MISANVDVPAFAKWAVLEVLMVRRKQVGAACESTATLATVKWSRVLKLDNEGIVNTEARRDPE